ncbi:M28 family metallopeptidase [Clostridium tarantellae]|uniref:M28 family peptidase n=1 Tax=Clostridium tarantellae TaxID=39493 RepID=A0A6I1MKQ6_9CLOT|nr:M28 family metallopeptidase [Clostridium tarantellae]MPQ43564.1 M28 family peptidase [Clostridium tarantellae]
MKKLKSICINLLIFILLSTFILSIFYKIRLDTFNKDELIDRIEYLTSDELKGRLCGSEGNYLAQDFIKKDFKKSNLLPYNFKFLHEFSTHSPTEIEGKPYLKVVDSNGTLIKEYEYNRDFKDAFLNFKINKITFNKNNKANIHTSAMLINNSNNKNAVFISTEMNSFNFRSSFVYNTPCDLYTLVSPKTFNELVEYYNNDYTIECFFPYKVEEKIVNNVASVIKGFNPFLPPLVLTAHFDHVGSDLSGNIYRGALDNASGAAFLMELASVLSTLPMPERDIIIVALNAEEFGLLGAEEFAKENSSKFKNSKVINFDMIGSDENIPLTLMTGKNITEDTSELLKNLSNRCKEEKITHLIEKKDSSDHAGFIKQGIDSVTINDGDTSKIHTPEDKVEFISTTAIDRALSVVFPEIINYAYSSSPFFLLSTPITILLFIMLILAIVFKKINK